MYKRQSLGISGVVQGDFLFTSESISTKQIGGEECITFQPNTITYAVPTGTPMGDQIKSSKIAPFKLIDPSIEEFLKVTLSVSIKISSLVFISFTI